MILKNDNIGLLVGTFIGSAIGSICTVFALKKLNKLEYNKDIESERQRIQEVCTYYEEKLKEVKSIKKTIETAKDNVKIEEEIKYNNPKYTYQDRLSSQISVEDDEQDDPADFNEGNAVLEVDRGVRPAVDYSKISRIYDGLTKEYEREENKNVIEFPYIISRLNYERDTGYKKVELMYYEQNGIFATLDDVMSDEYTIDYFGLDNVNIFGSEEANPTGDAGGNDLYLRDKTLLIDFHLIYNPTEDFDKIVGNC